VRPTNIIPVVQHCLRLNYKISSVIVGIHMVWIWQIIVPAASPIASINTLS